MSRPGRWLRLGVPLWVVLSQSTQVVAQPARASGASEGTAAAQPVERARARYRLAAEAFEAGRYREAVDSFLEADRLAPSAALSFNIAQAYERLGDSAATLRWLRDYLRRAPEAPDRAQVEVDVRKLEAELAARGLQQVTVVSEPQGATVALDGKPVGVTPWTSELSLGPHRLELTLSGRAPVMQELTLSGDRSREVSVPLPEAKASAPAGPPAAVPPPATPPTPAALPRDPGATQASAPWMVPVGWITVGTGGALLGGALVAELLRQGAESDAESEKTQLGYSEALDRMEGRQTAARILGVAGVVVGAAGGVLLWLGYTGDTSPQVGAACVPGVACSGAVRGVF